MYCHSAVAFNVFMFFSCFYVLRTVCVVVFFFGDIIDIFSCRPTAILINDSCYQIVIVYLIL